MIQAAQSAGAQLGRNPNSHPFLFATGIECSYPVITSKKSGRSIRRDELEICGHYEHWKEDLQLVRDMGLEYLRYGPPLYRVHRGPGRYDWSFCDEVFEEMQRLEVVPIVDLCHFGVPDFVGDFQNPDFPRLLGEYAGAFAQRYPWVRLYTPVNEIYVCAQFSARFGYWNGRLKSERAFVTALRNMADATHRAEWAILDVQPSALFIQSEATSYFHPENPDAINRATTFNEHRFLALDLSYGHEVTGETLIYLMDNGLDPNDYIELMRNGRLLKPYCIMGNDYYPTNEHLVAPGDKPPTSAGAVFGYYVITREYFERYHLPVMHTETNFSDSEQAPHWLWKQWAQVTRLKRDGVPILGFTWYSLTDQIDWDTGLAEDNDNVNPVGLFDLHRNIRPVGEAYRKLVSQWRDILPMETLAMDLSTEKTTPRTRREPHPLAQSR